MRPASLCKLEVKVSDVGLSYLKTVLYLSILICTTHECLDEICTGLRYCSNHLFRATLHSCSEVLKWWTSAISGELSCPATGRFKNVFMCVFDFSLYKTNRRNECFCLSLYFRAKLYLVLMLYRPTTCFIPMCLQRKEYPF